MGPNKTKVRAGLLLGALALAVAGLVVVQLPELIRYIKMERM